MDSGFDSLALSPALLAVVAELGYEQLTPIQAQSIPVLLAGRDLIGQSKTGSGKTAAFGLPILQRLALERRELQALVLCPTRELCAQVARELRKLGRKHEGLQVLTLAGGEPLRAQTAALERGVHIAVGTPGRVLDHLKRQNLQLQSVATAVLDEADRMLDMGFTEDMTAILGALPSSRQTVLFSATFPDSIGAISQAHQRDALRVTIDDDTGAAAQIRQLALEVEQNDKLRALYWVLGQYPHESALVFCNLKVTVAELTGSLCRAGLSADCLHGDLEQFQRDRVMAMFRNHSVRVLVATDVAARGLDVKDLELVINYDLPAPPEVYIHRVGRTGRAGKLGVAVSLLTRQQRRKLGAIEQLADAAIERLPPVPENAGIQALASELGHQAKMDTIQISGGRKDKLRPGDILGALTGEAGGLSAGDVGKIEIHDRLAYVAVASGVSRGAVKSLNEQRVKGKRFRAIMLPRFRG